MLFRTTFAVFRSFFTILARICQAMIFRSSLKSIDYRIVWQKKNVIFIVSGIAERRNVSIGFRFYALLYTFEINDAV